MQSPAARNVRRWLTPYTNCGLCSPGFPAQRACRPPERSWPPFRYPGSSGLARETRKPPPGCPLPAAATTTPLLKQAGRTLKPLKRSPTPRSEPEYLTLTGLIELSCRPSSRHEKARAPRLKGWPESCAAHRVLSAFWQGKPRNPLSGSKFVVWYPGVCQLTGVQKPESLCPSVS